MNKAARLEAADDTIAGRPPKRRRLAFGLGTSMLLVALIALGLGLYTHSVRRAAVAEFMRDVRAAGGEVRVRWSGSYPGRDYQINDMSARLNPAIIRLRKAGAVDLAVTALVAEIEADLAKGDNRALMAPIAVLHFLGDGRSDAAVAAYHVARSGLWADVRLQAVGLLGHLGEVDREAIRSLGKLLGCTDAEFVKWLLNPVIFELGILGPMAGDQTPALLALLRSLDRQSDPQGLRISILRAVSQVGRGTTESLPDLLAILDDSSESLFLRSQALEAISGIAIFIGPKTELPHAFPKGVIEGIQRIAEREADPQLKGQAVQCLSEVAKREGWGQRMPAGWAPSRRPYSTAVRKTPSTVTKEYRK